MEASNTMERINDIAARARQQVVRSAPAAHSSNELELELNRRRKHYLGSHIPLWCILENEGEIYNDDVDLLAQHLSKQTMLFWNQKGKEAFDFCYHFYRLSMFALFCDGIRECVDDILQLAKALVRSKEVFRIAEQDLLPPEMFYELFAFLEESNEEFFHPDFEDAVLFAIADFLGALGAPKDDHIIGDGGSKL